MQIKNKILTLIISILPLFFCSNICADEFNISAIEISLDKKNNIIEGTGSVVVTDQDGKIIKSNKAIYKKLDELVILDVGRAVGRVLIS